MVAPITLDLTGKDVSTDVVIKDRSDIGKPFVVTLVHAHMVADYQLIAYVGRLNERTVARIIKQMKTVLADFCEISRANVGDE